MSKILSVPEQARGMTTLDETAFKKTVVFPVLHVGVQDLNKIRGKVRLEKYLVKNLANVKNVADSEDPTEKLLLFDPDIIHEAGEDLKTTIAEQVAAVSETTPRWDVKEIPVSFDNWDSRSVFRAILPDGLEFSSFTQTGHIIHCNFHADLAPYKSIIGEILLRKVRQAKTVVNKVDGIATKYRNFEIELVAGEENYLTTVTERGINYKMDFSKVFWNSRLQHEHERVTQFLTKNSLVFDACAGIGPFVLPAAKQKRCRIVYANDLNPESIKWLETNRDSNKIQPEQVRTFNMDAAEFIKGPVATKIAEEFNSVIGEGEKKPEDAHIIMNLPAYSVNFLPAFDGLLQGKIDEVQNKNVFPIWVYCYLFVKAHEDVESSWFVDRAYEMVKEKLGWTDENLDKRITAHHVRTVSTRKEMFCMRISLPIDYLLCGEKEPAAKKAKKEEE